MDRIKNILVGIDFSPCSAAALKQAVRMATSGRAKVVALRVVEVPAFALPDGVFAPFELPPVDLLLSAAHERWTQWPAAREVGGAVAFDVVLGLPRMELLDRARRESVDLLILGAHGNFDTRSGLGSTAAACVQRAETRVMVVREGQTGPFRSVTACVDFTDTSKLALEQAIRLAAQDNAALHILHVYADPWRGVRPSDEVKVRLPDLAQRYGEAVERHVRAFCEPLAHELRALKAAFHAVLFEGHGKGIVDFVTRERSDLVVLGTRAKWNVRDFVWGSTAERVVREAPCSVLTVKPLGMKPR